MERHSIRILSERTLSRRRLLTTALTLPLTVGGLVSGCARGGGKKTVVRFWNGFTGPDGRTMLHMVQRFNASNPDVEVLMQRMDWATYYNKLFVSGLGGRAPEVFVLQTHSVPRFARANFVRAIDDLTARPDGLDVKDIDPNVSEAIHINGKHYGVPLDIWPLGMYYNRALLKEAGIVDTAGNALPPTDRDSFLNAAIKMTKPGTNGKPDRWGFVFTNFESNIYTLMMQYGGQFFNEDYTQCTVNNQQNVAALQFGVDLIHKYKVAPSPENYDSWIGFRQGKIGMVFEGIYMLADLQKQKDLDFSGAPVPLFGQQKAVWSGSHNLCMRADLKGKTLEGAWRFIRFLSDNSLDWAEGGQVPVRRSLRETPRFAAMEVQAQFARQIPYVHYLPRLPFIFEFQTEFGLALEKALRGRATPEEALALAMTNINKIMQRDRENGGGK